MATKKKESKARGMVKITQTSINKVKVAIVGTGQTIGDFYETAADKQLSKQSKNK